MDRKEFDFRKDYLHFLDIPTRWMDNDLYGHVNNVVYYSYFDTVVNQFMIERAGLNIHEDPIIGVVVETMCRYRKSIAFPDIITAGLRVAHIGNSSVRHEIGIFAGGDDQAAACGHFVHAFVDRAKNKPTRIPDSIRGALQSIQTSAMGQSD